jgi:hypothetical protein
MSRYELVKTPSPAAAVLSDCPQCNGRLAVLRITPGRSGREYWTMRCTRCGGIHLNVVEQSPAPHAT